MVASLDLVITGFGIIKRSTVSFALQLFAVVPVTIYRYVLLPGGVATGLDMFGLFRPVAGDQLYVTPPEAFSCICVPSQSDVLLVAVTTGFSTVILTESLLICTGAKEISSSAKSLPITCVFIFTIEILAVVFVPEFQVV